LNITYFRLVADNVLLAMRFTINFPYSRYPKGRSRKRHSYHISKVLRIAACCMILIKWVFSAPKESLRGRDAHQARPGRT